MEECEYCVAGTHKWDIDTDVCEVCGLTGEEYSCWYDESLIRGLDGEPGKRIIWSLKYGKWERYADDETISTKGGTINA